MRIGFIYYLTKNIPPGRAPADDFVKINNKMYKKLKIQESPNTPEKYKNFNLNDMTRYALTLEPYNLQEYIDSTTTTFCGIRFGTQVNDKNVSGHSPLYISILEKNEESAMILIENGAEVGNDEITICSVNKMYNLLRSLLNRTDLHRLHIPKFEYDNTIVDIVFEFYGQDGLFDAYEWYIENRVDIAYLADHYHVMNFNPLALAAYYNNLDAVKILIDQYNPNISITTTKNWPLGAAVHHVNLEMVKILLDAGAYKDTKSKDGLTLIDVYGTLLMSSEDGKKIKELIKL